MCGFPGLVHVACSLSLYRGVDRRIEYICCIMMEVYISHGIECGLGMGKMGSLAAKVKQGPVGSVSRPWVYGPLNTRADAGLTCCCVPFAGCLVVVLGLRIRCV